MAKRLLYRPLWLAAAISGVVLVAGVALMVRTSSRGLARLAPLHNHMANLNRIQKTGLDLEEELGRLAETEGSIPPQRIDQLLGDADILNPSADYLVHDTPDRLREIRRLIAEQEPRRVRASLQAALEQLRQVSLAESTAHESLLAEATHDNRLESTIAVAVVGTLAALGLLLFFLLRRMVVEPVGNIGNLLKRLADRDYRSVETADAGPLLRPLLDSYNYLVGRLADLEEAHRRRQQSLEADVRTATQALLQQHRSLAHAERLAAVGEIAAGVAHELRNPLAGVQLALENLQSEVGDSAQRDRLAQVTAEVKRVVRLLNDLLSASENEPEPAKQLDVAHTISELFSLLRYQLSGDIELVYRGSRDLVCRLPQDGLRQVLLNLVLNSVQALGDGGGTIELTAARDADRLRIWVTDDGPGFPAAFLEQGVRTFVSRREAGTGLGLAMVRRFSRDLGGELSIGNREPHGARVGIALPYRD